MMIIGNQKNFGDSHDEIWSDDKYKMVESEGISSGAVQCIETRKNTNGKSTLSRKHLH